MEYNNFNAYKNAITEMPYEELDLRNYFVFRKVMEEQKLCIQMLEYLIGRKLIRLICSA